MNQIYITEVFFFLLILIALWLIIKLTKAGHRLLSFTKRVRHNTLVAGSPANRALKQNAHIMAITKKAQRMSYQQGSTKIEAADDNKHAIRLMYVDLLSKRIIPVVIIALAIILNEYDLLMSLIYRLYDLLPLKGKH